MPQHPTRVGEIRPSQLLYSYGVGAILDLPHISVIVTGLEDWPTDPQHAPPIIEDRLLAAVRWGLPEVRKLLAAPTSPDAGPLPDPFDQESLIGVPVATFPRWMVCPDCDLLAPLSSGLFQLKEAPYHPDRTAYRHENCNKGKHPQAVPARVLVACENGHLDDFPWVAFVHDKQPCSGSPLLRLFEFGASGEARDLAVRCETCGAQRFLAQAFGKENAEKLPRCRGRRPHLRDFDPNGCDLPTRTLILGASNTWFAVVYSTIAIPVATERLPRLVAENWATLGAVTAENILGFMRALGQLGELAQFSDAAIWAAIQTKRQQDAGEIPAPNEIPDLKAPEWAVFTQHNPALNGEDFRLRPVTPPARYVPLISQVVLAERLREVRALVGFTRLEALGELGDPDLRIDRDPAPLARTAPTWVPAAEVRGEGIFIAFDEAQLTQWLDRAAVHERGLEFYGAHQQWRRVRGIEPPDEGYPGMRYVLLHTFAHALMRALALECGYAAASLRERIYSRPAETEGGPMAGVLIYTSAPDSEGTLGGLVSLGETATLERHISAALEAMRLCASDPLCAEHAPTQTGQTLHAAACHACLFSPETSCERGNKYLDRSLLVATVERADLAFFE